MDSLQAIASELSYLVRLQQLDELNGKLPKCKRRDAKPVKAPAEQPSRFVRDERLHSGVRADKALR